MHGIESSRARTASRTAWSTDRRSTPGIEGTATRVFLPSTTNSGQIRSSVVSRFSRTMRRAHSVRRLRRGRLVRSSAAPCLAAGSISTGRRRALDSAVASIGRSYLRAMALSPGTRLFLTVPRQGCHWAGGPRIDPDQSRLYRSPDGRGHAMDFELSEEQAAFQATAREFAAAEMMPHARAWDENEIFPVETLRKAAALGF